MLEIFKTNKLLSIVFVVVMVGGLLYFYFNSSSSAPVLSNSQTISPASAELLATLGRLNTIVLDDSIFTDPAFASLNDFGITIPPENKGRRNPFAPIGSAESATPAASATQ